jgi:imidazolonepropionase-like amidohydrolase
VIGSEEGCKVAGERLSVMKRRVLAISAATAGVAVGALTAQSKSTVAIVGATIIPMTSGAVALPNHTVIVSGDRITAVGPAARATVPAGALRIDAGGKFVMPGLADMHVHLEYFDQPEILGLFVANGVTTVRNMDGRPYILEWKRRIASGDLSGPRIYTAGPLLDGNPPVRSDNTVVNTHSEAVAAVEEQAAAGYDFVKIYSALGLDAYQGIVSSARTHKLPISGHVPRAVGLDRILADGVRSIEHLADYAAAIEADTSPFKGKGHWSKRYLSAPIDPTRLRALALRHAKAGVWSVPTLMQPVRELLRDDEIASRLASEEVGYIPADGRAQWESMARRVASRIDEDEWKLVAAGAANRLQVVAAFHAAGVPLLMGTDTPNPFVVPGFSLHDELALAVRAGLSPLDALAASTREAARFVAADWGTIEAGKAADLVVLDANPLDAIEHTRKINGVLLRGKWLSAGDRARLLGTLREKR